ncbi:MAG: hypothetical protein RIS79_2028 [Verrucomicrobiota bacterium]
MKQTHLLLLAASLGPFQLGWGQIPPPAGYGTMGMSAPPMTAPPPSVPAYPSSTPPPNVSGTVAPPPVGYTDPYAAPPPNMEALPPQGTNPYGAPPPPPRTYGGSMGMGYAQAVPGIVNYNYLEFNYRYLQPKNKGLDGANTIGGTLSVALFEPLFLKFGAFWGSGKGAGTVDTANSDYDFAAVQAAVGFHTQLIDQRLQFSGEAGLQYANLKSTNSTASFSDGAIYVRPSLRFAPTEAIEVQAGVTVSSADNYDSKILDLSGYFRVMPKFDIGIGADFGDATRGFRGNLRYRW